MQTEIYDLNKPETDKVQTIDTCGALICSGEIVVFPTETVYGLGANAFDSEAVKKIFAAKGRPGDNPLIVHVAEKKDVLPLVKAVPEKAKALMDAFWPGPLTLIMPVSDKIPKTVTAGLNTVAIRMPSSPTAHALIASAGVPIAAPSANISGRPSPTEGSHVIEDMSGKVPAILIADEVEVGLESTVIDMTSEPPTLLRPGGITAEEIESVIGSIALSPNITANIIPEKVMSPGMKYKHYAPKGQVIIVKGNDDQRLCLMRKAIGDLSKDGNVRIGILTTEDRAALFKGKDFNKVSLIQTLGDSRDPKTLGRHLFDCLRRFDTDKIDRIYAEDIPITNETLALINRLYKSAGYTFLQEETKMTIAIGSDHGGFDLKSILIDHLTEEGYDIMDCGTDSTASVDYPVYGKKVGHAVVDGQAEKGIIICGTGIGISLAANKVPGVRAALCTNEYMAEMSRRHNNANVLALGARVIGSELAKNIVKRFLSTDFEGGRHERRVAQIES